MRSNSCVESATYWYPEVVKIFKIMHASLLLFSNDLDVLAVNKYQSRLDVDEIVQTMALLQRFL